MHRAQRYVSLVIWSPLVLLACSGGASRDGHDAGDSGAIHREAGSGGSSGNGHAGTPGSQGHGSGGKSGSGASGSGGRGAGASGSGGHAQDSGVDGANGSGGTGNDAGTMGGMHGSQWVIGYYPGYERDKLPTADIDWSGLSHIVFATIKVNADFTLGLDFYVGSEDQGKAAATEIADAANAHGVTPLLMLGGAGVNNISGAISADVTQLAQRLITTMTDLHYAGIDLDIEDGSPLPSVVMLAKTLREMQPDIVLTYPGPSRQFAQTTVEPEYVELATYLDRFAIQSYYGGNNGLFTGSDDNGHRFYSWFASALSGATDLTPYAIDDALQKFSGAGIPKAKLAMGIAGYAACYKIPDTTPPGGSDVSGPRMETNAPSSWCWDCGTGGGDGSFSLSALFAGDGAYVNAKPSERKRDDVAKEPYLGLDSAVNDSHCGGSTRYIIYGDETSIRDKGAFSKKNGYGGIIVWTIPQMWLPDGAAEGRARNALFQALKQGFLDP